MHPDNIYVLYHGNCYDGFGAAYATWLKLGDRAKYIPVTHGQPMPDMANGSIVYILDFSYPREDLIALARRMADVVVLDHHKTAQEALSGIDVEGLTIVFDMNKSGARLAWEWWFPTDEMPNLLRYVEDRDLWRFALPESREVSEALRAYPMKFDVWDELSVPTLKLEGKIIMQHTAQQVQMMCNQARQVALEDGTPGVMVNATGFWSEIGHRLLEEWPAARFAVSYYDDKRGNRVYSLRSRPDYDVSALAKANGGGGHAQAAGFTIPKGAGLWLDEAA